MDSRAVSPLIGFILLMSIVMGLIGILQANAVPQWNRAVEAKHFSDLKYDVASLGEAISLSSSTGNQAKIVLKAGVDYPNYYVLVSPSKASTTISVKDLGIRILNIDGSTLVEDETSAIIFEPNYFYSSRSKLIYEHSAVLRLEDSVVLKESDQNSFSKNSISLYILKAKFNSFATTETANLILIPVSVGGRNLFSGNIIFECFDEKTAEWWNSTLKEVYKDNPEVKVSRSGNVVEVANLKSIILSINVFEVYAVVGGETSQDFGVTPDKFIPLTDTQFSVYQYSTVMLGAKLVDRFGNPVKNYDVTVSVSPSNGICNFNPYQTVTNERGEVWYYFNANVTPNDPNETVTCTVSFTANGVEPQYFTVEVNASVPFCEECPANGECPPCPTPTPCPTCPPVGSLSKVRGATLSGISCSPVCSSYNNSFVGWIDGQSIWANSTQNCAWQNFTFKLPYTINSSVSPILIWNGTCSEKDGRRDAYALIYLNNNLENPREQGLGGGELEVQLNANDFVNQQILVSIRCISKEPGNPCPTGRAPWNLSTNYIEILFVKQ
ncbi:MAG: hypothetical protein QFX40_01660 [Archaeoglobales archaeon]|nr:hypothetical protein [Archaeoglobales archaeon]